MGRFELAKSTLSLNEYAVEVAKSADCKSIFIDLPLDHLEP